MIPNLIINFTLKGKNVHKINMGVTVSTIKTQNCRHS